MNLDEMEGLNILALPVMQLGARRGADQISADTQTNLIEVYCGFPQFIWGDSRILLPVRMHPLESTFSISHPSISCCIVLRYWECS
jgi:hypothetical protein